MRKLLLVATLAVALCGPAWNARAEDPEQYKLNLEALYSQVKGLDAAKLPAEKHLALWEDFLERFPHDNPHADEARERVKYWTSQKGAQPAATQAPSAAPAATKPPATQTPGPAATQTPVPQAATTPPAAPTQAAGSATPGSDASPVPSNPAPDGRKMLEIHAFQCAYLGSVDPKTRSIGISPADRLAQQAVEDIAALARQQPDFQLLAGDIETILAAQAGIDGQPSKVILYNPGFVAGLRGAARGRWPVYGVLAHAMAHHISRQISPGAPVRDQELWADDFSGAILFKMGASLEQAQTAVLALRGGAPEAVPSGKARRNAVANGWHSAADKEPGRRRGPKRDRDRPRTGTGLPN